MGYLYNDIDLKAESIETPRKKFPPTWWRRSYSIGLIVLLSILLHAWSVWLLPVDFDEPVYLQVGADYAKSLKSGDISGLVNYQGNLEHPSFVKLLYSLPYLLTDVRPGSQTDLYIARSISALFGVLAVLLVAIIDPLAGLLYALHGMSLKYTSQAYLEAVPMFTCFLSILAFKKAQEGDRKWLWISAIALGVTAASKYTYLMVVVVLIFLVFQYRNIGWKPLLMAAGLSVLVFLLFNPGIWSNPIQRLFQSLLFHTQYAQGTHVQSVGYPWYQPFVWLFSSPPWHPQVYFFILLDGLIFGLAILGFYFEICQKRIWLLVWFITGILVLLVWPTKWPQYTIILAPVTSLAAATFLRKGYHFLRHQESYWNYFEAILPQPPKIFWYVLIGFVAALGLGKVVFEFDMAFARRGWYQYSVQTAPLPTNMVSALAWDHSGEMLMGTENGIAVWKPSKDLPWELGSDWLQPNNSPLPMGRILNIYSDFNQTWWIGTLNGLVRFDGQSWQTFITEDTGLSRQEIHDIAQDSDGHIWITTMGGIAEWNGTNWAAYNTSNSRILDDSAFSIVIQPLSDGDRIWIGSLKGVSRFQVNTNEWTTYDFSNIYLGWGGVIDLMIDQNQTVWAASLGGGLGQWDGADWIFHRTDNSKIPGNNITSLLDSGNGKIWVGFNYAAEPGGFLATYDGKVWKKYVPNNSGYLGSEPLALAMDDLGRLWIGTATGGLQIFEQ